MTGKTLLLMSNEESFDLFWMKVSKMAEDMEVNERVLPRKRKMPKRFEDGAAAAEFPSSPKDMYRQVYFGAVDLLVQAIADGFDQQGYRTYRCLQDLLFKAIEKQDYTEQLKEVMEVFSSDINPNNLKIQRDTFANSCCYRRHCGSLNTYAAAEQC